MALVELPCLVDGDPHKVGLLKDVPESANGALKERGMGDGGLKALRFDQLTSFDNLFVALGTERNIDPTSELILEVPCRLAVSYEDKSTLVGSLSGGEAGGREARGMWTKKISQRNKSDHDTFPKECR